MDPRHAHKGPRLLLVADHELVRSAVARALTKVGFEVTAAGDPSEGLALARDGDFDIVVTDLSLGGSGVDGLQLLRASRAAQPACRRVLFTAHADDARLAPLLEDGTIERLLGKPMSTADLALLYDFSRD